MSTDTLDVIVTNEGLITLAMLVILIPFLSGGALVIARLFEIRNGKKIKEKISGMIGSGSLGISWMISIIVAFQYFSKYYKDGHAKKVVGETAYLPMANSAFNWGILLDPLGVIFLVLLTTIAFVIHYYAVDYMHGDSAYTRFFGTLNLFTGSMLGFVLASNLFISFIYWELLGFTSYLLIGYYWPKASAAHAARKAFMYNKIGDVSFVLAMGFIYREMIDAGLTPSFNYVVLSNHVKAGHINLDVLALPAILLFGAAVGKSAQLPLFGWLPEAMEGPTPVSALLHSSTMVKAGLFLIARAFFTFYKIGSGDGFEVASMVEGVEFLTPGNLIAWFGTFTALMGGLMALTATDIKKVLAFSTVSQLGYIGLAIGTGGLTAGFFHLISHATFKSLLFLGAGAVIHSVHSQEMSDMGGLRTKMKWTYRAMTIGLLGLMGVPFMNGFWSKDAVLLSLKEAETVVGNVFLYWVAVLTAGITAFYSIKLWGLTFMGEARYDKDHVEPGPTSNKMRNALLFLASLVLIESIWFSVGTLAGLYGENHSLLNFEYSLGTMLGVHGGEFGWIDALPSTLAVLIFGSMSYFIYVKPVPSLVKLTTLSVTDMFASLSINRFGFDKALYAIAEGPVLKLGDVGQYIDKEIIDHYVIDKGFAEGGLMLADRSDWFDVNVVDGTVKYISNMISSVGRNLRELQSGKVSNYAKYMILGMVVLLSYFALVNLEVIPGIV